MGIDAVTIVVAARASAERRASDADHAATEALLGILEWAADDRACLLAPDVSAAAAAALDG